MKSNFAQFYEEYEDMYTIEKDYGFITYKFINDAKACYLVNGFIREENRGDKLIYKLVDELVNIAKDCGYNLLLTSVDPDSKNPKRSRKIFEGYGFKFKKCADSLEWYAKEI